MATIAEAMDAATAELRQARIAVDALRQTAADQLSVKVTQAQTVIQNFLTKPVQQVFVDPLNGSDAADGLTVTTPKRSPDAVIGAMGLTATQIILLNDATLALRQSVFADLSILGARPANTARGWDYILRHLFFLGVANNSPIDGASACAGLDFSGQSLLTDSVDFVLPDQPAGQALPSHFYSQKGTSFSFIRTALNAGSNAGYLVGTQAGRSSVFFSGAISTSARGHVFQGVAANADPNALWAYSSNLTSA